jgi:hypothetical protein
LKGHPQMQAEKRSYSEIQFDGLAKALPGNLLILDIYLRL